MAEMTAAERVEWIMTERLGFPKTETGPNVTALREMIRKLVTEKGLVDHSAGTWAPECGPAGMYLPHEERAGYMVEFRKAVEAGSYTDMPPLNDSHRPVHSDVAPTDVRRFAKLSSDDD